ncbi:FAD-dependent oxidoreductase [Bacteroidota bacterium]
MSETNKYDIIIYGGTSAGIMAAVQSRRMGRSVLIIEPSGHLGGMTTGGLGATDFGIKETIGGLAKEFYERIFIYYSRDESWTAEKREDFSRIDQVYFENDSMMRLCEPHVAMAIFKELIDENNIDVILNERIDLDSGVLIEDNRISAIITESGRLYSGKIFIDATYEGDLMAMAGVDYHVGRESKDTYNESLGGVLPYYDSTIFQPKKFFGKNVSPFDENGDLIFGIQDVPMGKTGQGDKKIQAYNFRVCLTKDIGNRIPITRPDTYDSSKYELLARYIEAEMDITLGRRVRKPGILTITMLPNLKTDINDGGVFSTDYIGANWDYPEGDYHTRQKIWDDHLAFTKGLLYFIGHSPRVPEHIRQQMLVYGYPKDEFTESGNWPPQLYVREARRMIGQYIMTQSDCKEDPVKNNSIGIGSYAPDSHHIQRIVTVDGEIINEGNIYESHNAYEIPLGVILPEKLDCANLLVPVCVSSSHIAFGSIRMEPVFMILGQSAATLACLSLDNKRDMHDINYNLLHDQLLVDKQILKINKVLSSRH